MAAAKRRSNLKADIQDIHRNIQRQITGSIHTQFKSAPLLQQQKVIITETKKEKDKNILKGNKKEACRLKSTHSLHKK